MTDNTSADIRNLLQLYADAKGRADAAKETMEDLKKILFAHTKTAGGYIAVDGIGYSRVMPDSVTIGYDTKSIDEIVHELIQAGQNETAQKVSAARRSNKRKSYLRIVISNEPSELESGNE
jgi:hypothetical protein